MAQGLTIRQEKFCQKYLECGNASEAYRFAYTAENMKLESVNRKAAYTLSLGKIRSRIEKFQQKGEKNAGITRQGIIDRLVAIIDADPSDYIDLKTGDVKAGDIKAMPKSALRLIEGVEPTANGVKITFASKKAAIERLCKMLGYDAEDKARAQELLQQREAMKIAIANMPDDRRKVLADIASDLFKTAPDAL